jgi:hypothetical protein
MLMRQTSFSLLYKRFRVVAKDNRDKSYFIVSCPQGIEENQFYWCRANHVLHIGTEVDGYLCPSEYFDKLPTLIIGECNSIIPSFAHEALINN